MGDLLRENTLYGNIYDWAIGIVGEDLAWLAYTVAVMAIILLVVNAFLAMGTLYTWAERRIIGRFQSRVGPNRVGPFGLLQAIADAVKLLFKEDIVPRAADRIVFNLAPIAMLAPSVMALAVIPFGQTSYLANLNIGLLYLIATSGIASLAVMMAGYASSNRYAMFGAMRAVAMLISYEIPLVMVLLAVALLAGSMSLVDVMTSQAIPFLLVTPLGAIIFFLAISAELNRSPFDITEAESELIAGYLTEYSGMKFGVFYLAEFANVLLAGAIFSTLFLGGWPWWTPLSHVWFLVKVMAFAFIAIWVRSTIPRFRIDQIMVIAWKVLFPLSLVNVAAIAIEVVAWPERTLPQLVIMGIINWGITAVATVAVTRAWRASNGLRVSPSARAVRLEVG